MALIKPLHADFELTENECLFGMYQAFQKCIPLYFAPSLSMKCTVASCGGEASGRGQKLI